MYWVLLVASCVEPRLSGPFATRQERDAKAAEVAEKEYSEYHDVLLLVDHIDGDLAVTPYMEGKT